MDRKLFRDEGYLRELRLFLKEVCCDLCRFQHLAQGDLGPEDIHINQEVYLSTPGAFADIRVMVPGATPYFVEIKYGYPPDKIIRHLRRKYGTPTHATADASKLILVADSAGYTNWPEVEGEIRACLRPGLDLEVCGEEKLLSQIQERFNLNMVALREGDLAELH